jgi:hypothetical protein
LELLAAGPIALTSEPQVLYVGEIGDHDPAPLVVRQIRFVP